MGRTPGGASTATTGPVGVEASDAPLLEVRDLSMTFPGVRALAGVHLEVHPGEILALLGHNGSGKSTLVKVLAGLYKPDLGSTVEVASDIHFIHQDLGLVPMLTTVENLDLDDRTGIRNLRPTRRCEIENARASIARFGGRFDVTVPISRITPAERTIVAIARATSSWTSARNVLVLDEPTATLHGPEADRLRAVVRAFAAEGAAILYISHHLAEVVDLADRALVLRDGQVVLSATRGDFDEDTLLRSISGDRDASTPTSRSTRSFGNVALHLRGLTTPRISGLDLDVQAGEILGLGGLIGSGRDDILGLIFGVRPAQIRELSVAGRPVQSATTAAKIRAGISFVPADRRGLGSIPTFTARENLTLSTLPRLGPKAPILSRASERRSARAAMAELGVRPLEPERPFPLFSGGNQQKIVIAKWLRTKPRVMLLDEPTQGVDVGARAGIHDLVRSMAQEGTAVVVASADEKELADLCDRVIVLRDGHIASELRGSRITEDNILRACLTTVGRDELKEAT